MFRLNVRQQLVNGLPEVLAALLAVENRDKIVFCGNVHLPLLDGNVRQRTQSNLVTEEKAGRGTGEELCLRIRFGK